MLIRTCKDKNNPYVMLNTSFLENRNLSLKAKGLLAYCMSKPDGWSFSVKQLKTVLMEGDSLIDTFNELITNEYCITEQIRSLDDNFERLENEDEILYILDNKIFDVGGC